MRAFLPLFVGRRRRNPREAGERGALAQISQASAVALLHAIQPFSLGWSTGPVTRSGCLPGAPSCPGQRVFMDPLGGFRLGGILLECLGNRKAGRGSAGVTAGRSGRAQPKWLKPCRPTVAIVIAVMANDAAPIIRLRVMLIYPLRSVGVAAGHAIGTTGDEKSTMA